MLGSASSCTKYRAYTTVKATRPSGKAVIATQRCARCSSGLRSPAMTRAASGDQAGPLSEQGPRHRRQQRASACTARRAARACRRGCRGSPARKSCPWSDQKITNNPSSESRSGSAHSNISNSARVSIARNGLEETTTANTSGVLTSAQRGSAGNSSCRYRPSAAAASALKRYSLPRRRPPSARSCAQIASIRR